jgi:hypothetical protein
MSIEKIKVDLFGPDGNAFYFLNLVKTLSKQLGMSREVMVDIQTKMISGNYENLLKVFCENFGDYVDLQNGPRR